MTNNTNTSLTSNVLTQQQRLDEQIKQIQGRNRYLKKNIQQMRQALDDNKNMRQDSKMNIKQSVNEVGSAISKQLQTIEKNILIAQRQLSKIKSSTLSFDELMNQSQKLEKQLKEKSDQKKTLLNEILKLKKQMYIKQRNIDQPQIIARNKAQSYQLQIKVLNKKLSLLSTTSKPNASVLMARSPSVQQPIQRTQLPSVGENRQSKQLKQELNLYMNLSQSYQKKLQTLQTQVAALQLKQRHKAEETDQIDREIDQWIVKIDLLKKTITPNVYRKHATTQKKLVKIN